MDGVLTTAVERGDWVLLEGANRCPAAVLDRLNPLLEPNGSLLLNEAGDAGGTARVLRPHPDFRLFLTVDPGCDGVELRTLCNALIAQQHMVCCTVCVRLLHAWNTYNTIGLGGMGKHIGGPMGITPT